MYILDNNSITDSGFANIFFHYVGCLSLLIESSDAVMGTLGMAYSGLLVSFGGSLTVFIQSLNPLILKVTLESPHCQHYTRRWGFSGEGSQHISTRRGTYSSHSLTCSEFSPSHGGWWPVP